MASFHMICAVVGGFTASILLYLPNLKKEQKKQGFKEKLRMITEALEQAEQRVIRFQERHDRILAQVCSFYLCNEHLDEALVGARTMMNEALEFAVSLQQLQMKIIRSYPDPVTNLF
ncbi:hypothetical protein ACHQM5_026563 [Ranunculus cassubicifolius]